MVNRKTKGATGSQKLASSVNSESAHSKKEPAGKKMQRVVCIVLVGLMVFSVFGGALVYMLQ